MPLRHPIQPWPELIPLVFDDCLHATRAVGALCDNNGARHALPDQPKPCAHLPVRGDRTAAIDDDSLTADRHALRLPLYETERGEALPGSRSPAPTQGWGLAIDALRFGLRMSSVRFTCRGGARQGSAAGPAFDL